MRKMNPKRLKTKTNLLQNKQNPRCMMRSGGVLRCPLQQEITTSGAGADEKTSEKETSFAIIVSGLATETKAKEVCHLWQMTIVVYHTRNGIVNIT